MKEGHLIETINDKILKNTEQVGNIITVTGKALLAIFKWLKGGFMAKSKYTNSTCVKLDDSQFSDLKEASRLIGKSIPEILRSGYFKKPIGRPLMANDMAKSIKSELRRIGNNVNQIARTVNSGIYEGWHDEFREFHQNFARVYQLIASYSRK